MKKKLTKKEQEYINRIILVGKNVTLKRELGRLLGELSLECQNDKLRAYIYMVGEHLENMRYYKCKFCKKKKGK